MNDPYEIAPGVLKNKYGITDPAKLAVVERAAAYQRILQLETQPIPGNFDFDHLKKITNSSCKTSTTGPAPSAPATPAQSA